MRIAHRRQTRKYGDNWKASLAQLKKQRVHKETLLKEIKFQMELFNLHINQGRDLCAKLSQPSIASTIKSAPASQQARLPAHAARRGAAASRMLTRHREQAQLAIEVVSPILANSANPLSVPAP